MRSSLPAHPVQFIAKLGRYLAVSLIGTATTLVLLGILVGWVNFSPGWSNLIAAGFSTALSFELDLRWVWRRQDRPALIGQVLPFWVWSLAELTLATLAVSWVGRIAVTRHWQHSSVTELVEVASIAISLLTWFAQYFIFDRIVFKERRVHVGGDTPRPAAPGVPPVTREVMAAHETPGRVARRRIGPDASPGPATARRARA